MRVNVRTETNNHLLALHLLQADLFLLRFQKRQQLIFPL